MRFADEPTVELTSHVGAPPSAVWPFVTDLDVLAQFSSEFQGGEWLDPPASRGVGAQFHGRNKNAWAEWEVTCTVTGWEPDRTFGWCVDDPAAPAASWRFTLAPTDGGTRLDYRARMGPGPSGVTSAIAEHPDAEERIVDRRLAEWTANMQSTLDGIQELAEGGPNPTDQLQPPESRYAGRGGQASASNCSHAAASRTSSPSISNTFRRDEAPAVIRTDPAATSSAPATASVTPRLARPSVAGSRTRTTSSPS